MSKEVEKKEERFDARITAEQKKTFKKAVTLGGYRGLTQFVILAAEEKAHQVIQKHEQILASKRDREVFFNEIINPSKPNQKLIDAVNEYKALFLNE